MKPVKKLYKGLIKYLLLCALALSLLTLAGCSSASFIGGSDNKEAEEKPVATEEITTTTEATEETTEEITEPVTEEVTEPTTEEVTEPPTEAATEPPTEAITEPPTQAVAEDAPETKPSPQYTYILNINTKKFHYPYCRSVNQMKESNKKEFTGTREEVINMGYDPCGNCKP